MDMETKVIDCNCCCHLNITEKQQSKLKSKGKIEPHICLKFGKRVLHNANTKSHASCLYPCPECLKELKSITNNKTEETQ